jgi:hypothetical protein
LKRFAQSQHLNLFSIFPVMNMGSWRRARISTPLSFSIEFDQTCWFALKMLEEMWDQDFEKPLVISGGELLLSGKTTVKEVFDYLRCYFDAYSKQLDFQITSTSPKQA